MQRYSHVLEERSSLINETVGIAQENQEMKALLEQYFRSSVNQELQIPPTSIIRANESARNSKPRRKAARGGKQLYRSRRG